MVLLRHLYDIAQSREASYFKAQEEDIYEFLDTFVLPKLAGNYGTEENVSSLRTVLIMEVKTYIIRPKEVHNIRNTWKTRNNQRSTNRQSRF